MLMLYVSNSERNVTGGIGSIEFTSKGDVLGIVYFVNEDSPNCPLVQFIPSANLGTSNEIMYSKGTHRHSRVDGNNFSTFSWVGTKAKATPQHHPNAEGIDVKDGFLYSMSKVDRTLFILNLAAGIFTKESTNHGTVRYQTVQLRLLVVKYHTLKGRHGACNEFVIVRVRHHFFVIGTGVLSLFVLLVVV